VPCEPRTMRIYNVFLSAPPAQFHPFTRSIPGRYLIESSKKDQIMAPKAHAMPRAGRGRVFLKGKLLPFVAFQIEPVGNGLR
jgi:hypothetical protein